MRQTRSSKTSATGPRSLTWTTSNPNSSSKSATRCSGESCKNYVLIWQYKTSSCRTKIQEGNKAIGEVLDWYEEVNSQTLAYVTYSIHDSDISDFYREVASHNQTLDNIH